MKVKLIKSSCIDFYDKEIVNNLIKELVSLNPSKEEHIDDYSKREGEKYWNLFIEINTIEQIEFIQNYFNEELVIDLRGEEPFIEVYDDYRE